MNKKREKIHVPYDDVKTWLRRRNLTYEEIGAFLNRSRTNISDIMNGKSDFMHSEILRLNQKYGIPIKKFYPEGFEEETFRVDPDIFT